MRIHILHSQFAVLQKGLQFVNSTTTIYHGNMPYMSTSVQEQLKIIIFNRNMLSQSLCGRKLSPAGQIIFKIALGTLYFDGV